MIVTRSLTLVSFERVSLIEYRYMHAKYEVTISYMSKVMDKNTVLFYRVTDRQDKN